jgi:hypothetical protein
MEYPIFFSWQADTKEDKRFIRGALDDAVAALKTADAQYPIVETDLAGMASGPETAAALLEIINSSAFFLADLTLVGEYQSASAGSRKTANPNVLIELGYAAGVMGWERILCVMNEAKKYGPPSALPADIRQRRWPIPYQLTPLAYNADPDAREKDQRDKAQSQLSSDLQAALRLVTKKDLETLNRAFKRLDANCLAVLKFHANDLGFLSPATSNASMKFLEPDNVVKTAAIPRLLDLGLIECGIHEGRYAYWWTYLGRILLEKHDNFAGA